MASNGIPTTYAGLNQWKLSDKPGMEDFNEDNQRIDGKLYEHGKELDAVRAGLADKANLYRLPLAEGIERHNAADYWKNGFGEVTVVFNLSRLDKAAFESGIIATLPEGYRPISYTAHSLGYGHNRLITEYTMLPFWIDNNGNLCVRLLNQTTTQILGFVSFVAR